MLIMLFQVNMVKVESVVTAFLILMIFLKIAKAVHLNQRGAWNFVMKMVGNYALSKR